MNSSTQKSKGSTRRKSVSPRAAVSRSDGAETRRLLLEAAGQVFGEKGYARATAKEICALSGANGAAVNYHFGSKENLYAEVLEEAHRRLLNAETLAAVLRSDLDARTRLKVVIAGVVDNVSRKDARAWELRVLSRELLNRSPMMERTIETQVLPKTGMILNIVAEIMGMPPEHPAVASCVVGVLTPCMFLLIADKTLQRRALPGLDTSTEALADYIFTFAVGGMAAVVEKVRAAE